MLDDGLITKTVEEQHRLERRLLPSFSEFAELSHQEKFQALTLDRTSHTAYLQAKLGELPADYISLDASRTWIVYWIVHSLSLLEAPLPAKPSRKAILDFLGRCQTSTGGFGGGPNQMAHLAATYAAVASLVILGGEDALKMVDRAKMFDFLCRMCVDPGLGGGLTVHEGGEVDVRGCFTAIATAHMLGLDKKVISEKCGMVDYVRRCQSHEGGLGGEPGNEAHGGYTFCGVAALILIDRIDAIDVQKLVHWAVHMQGTMEGGFKGRTNKLVDGCYSYWQGALFPCLSCTPALDICGASSGLVNDGLDWDVPDVPDLPDLTVGPPIDYVQSHEDIKLQKLSARLGVGLEDLEKRYGQRHSADLGLDIDSDDSDSEDPVDTFRQGVCKAGERMECTRRSVVNLIQGEESGSSSGDLHTVIGEDSENENGSDELYDALGLQFWILRNCQARRGGLRDKPGKTPDLYHTCYCLSGLSAAQHYSGRVLGPRSNLLAKMDPVVNIVENKLREALEYFADRPM